MSFVAQLRMIDPAEHFATCDLDMGKGVVTIGSRPTDDILLDSRDLFHLRLDYGQPPYRLTIPGDSRPITINDEFIPPGDSYDIRDRDVIRVAGYTITFRAYDDEETPGDIAQPSPAEPEPELPPPPEEPPSKPLSDEDGGEAEEAGPSIVVSLPEEEQVWAIDVEHTVTLHVTVANAGPLVAQFNLAVEGVPQDWVDVDPPEIHLNERASKTVTVTITPPRLPTSRAGTHRVTIVVTSPDHYAGERGEVSADITIKPYYELAVGNLSPRLQSISCSQPSGQVEVPLANRGNSELCVGLAGEDDAQASRFEFQVPAGAGEPLALSRQVQMSLPFDAALRVPVQIIPCDRPLVGAGGRLFDLRPRIYPYTVTVTMAPGQQGPWTLIGEWQNRPRFSRRVLALFTAAVLLLLLTCTCVVFAPGIASPGQTHPAWLLNPDMPSARYVQPASIRAGQLVELDWNAWPPFLVGFTLNGKSVEPPVIDRPERTTTYELKADTWLSHLLPVLSKTALDTVAVRPVRPDILLFEARPRRVTPGGTVVLSWVVDDARELVLVDHGAGVQETLATPYGSREVQVGDASTHYTLRAVAGDGSVVERTIAVQVGSPVIDVFAVNPPAVAPPGGDVTITWQVLGATHPVTLTRRSLTGSAEELVETTVDISGSRGRVVQPVRATTLFSLTAGSGITHTVDTVRVNVLKPTAAPAAGHNPTPTPTPTLAPPKAPADRPAVLVVYTALSPQELDQVGLGATPALSLTTLPPGLDETGLTLDQLKHDFDYVAPPSDAVAANVLIVRDSTEALIARLLAERENPRADAIWMVAATGMIRLRAEGLLEPLAGVYAPEGLAEIKAGWTDPTLPPQWIGVGAWLATLCVDEGRLLDTAGNPLPVPRTWADLADPIYRGQIVMPAPVTSGTGYMVVSSLIQSQPFGEREGWAYLDRLHENVAHYTRSGDEPCKLVAAGQAAIGIGANLCAAAGRYYPPEGAGWEMDAVALVRKDRIGDAALDFLTWAISRPAMEEYAQFRAALSYDGFEPSAPCVEGFGDLDVAPARLYWASANFQRIVDKWQERYGSRPD